MKRSARTNADLVRAYAKDAFALAEESYTFKEWDKTLKDLAAFVQTEEISMAMRSYNVPKEDFIEYLEDLLDKAGALDSEKEYILSLAIEERLSLVPQIQQQYSKMWRESQGIRDVHVVSANKLSGQEEKVLKTMLKERFNIQASLYTSVNPQLGSGMVIRFDNQVIDQSAKGYTERLKKRDIKMI